MTNEEDPKKIFINHTNSEPVPVPIKKSEPKDKALKRLMGYETDMLKPHFRELKNPGKLQKISLTEIFNFRMTKGTKN